MSNSARDLLVRGIAAAKSDEREEARFFLEWALRTGDITNEQRVDAWWWLSEITDDPAQKRRYLEDILSHNINHPPARRSLAILDGRLDPAEMIDVTFQTPTEEKPDQPQKVRSRRYTCPQCGGQLTFRPDGKRLICYHCHLEMDPAQAIPADETVDEQDFVVALATSKGHSRAVAMQTFQCEGCGVSFLLGPAVISLVCPYCGSAHVVEQTQTQRQIPPEGIIPFAIDQKQAQKILELWLENKGLRRAARTAAPRGIYAPVWTFDVSGEIEWRGQSVETTPGGVKTIYQTESAPVFFDDLLVPASRKFSNLAEAFEKCDLKKVVPYEPGYLADWPAETYQVAVSDASLLARKRAVELARQQVHNRQPYPVDITFSSSNIAVQSYKLILLPMWVCCYYYQDKKYNVIINGQTGHPRGQAPRSKIRKWFDKLLKGL